jgi:Fur family ferric uptake transcriptional regulator
MSETLTEYLHQHGLRKTLGRELVLATFINHARALSHGELNTLLSDQLNRATLYRVLQDFEQGGIVHKVPDDEVSVKYALCAGNCQAHRHLDNHVHFKCESCHETQCLAETSLPKVKLPAGFTTNNADLLLTGVCAQCQA